MKPIAAEIQSLAIEMPRIVRTNDYWRQRYPDLVQEVERRGRHKVWTPPANSSESSLFLEEMAPYLGDPFRGTLERRVLDTGQTSLSLESGAARRALGALGLGPGDIDITLCVSFLGDHAGLGNGAFLAKELELTGPAWNVESTCSGSLAALDLAASLIASERAERIAAASSDSVLTLRMPRPPPPARPGTRGLFRCGSCTGAFAVCRSETSALRSPRVAALVAALTRCPCSAIDSWPSESAVSRIWQVSLRSLSLARVLAV